MIHKIMTKEKAVSIYQEAKCHICGSELDWSSTDDYASSGLGIQAECCAFAHILTPEADNYSYTLREDPYEP